jgi:hypothetical protein
MPYPQPLSYKELYAGFSGSQTELCTWTWTWTWTACCSKFIPSSSKVNSCFECLWAACGHVANVADVLNLFNNPKLCCAAVAKCMLYYTVMMEGQPPWCAHVVSGVHATAKGPDSCAEGGRCVQHVIDEIAEWGNGWSCTSFTPFVSRVMWILISCFHGRAWSPIWFFFSIVRGSIPCCYAMQTLTTELKYAIYNACGL